MTRRHLTAILAGLVLSGCSATYPKGNVEQTIARMCEQEYHVQVSVKTAGKTIGAFIPVKDLLQSDLTLSEQALDRIEHVMLTVSRVTLSSEFQYDFFVVVAQDFAANVQIAFVRYIKDIRRLLTDDISRSDYFQRMLIEVRPIEAAGGPPRPVMQLTDYSLPEFLARQIAERMRQQLQINVVLGQLFGIMNVEGRFVPASRPGGRAPTSGTFVLTLWFHPDAPPFETLATAELRTEFTRLFLRVAQTLTRRYEFYAYDGLELVDAQGRQVAFFDRKQFTQDTVNTLMELIRSLKNKSK